MSDGLGRARRLVAQLDFPAAQQELREQLTQVPQDPAQAEVEDAETAALYAGVLLHLSEPHAARTWATYAHSAMRRLHGERDRRTLHALGVLAVTEHRAGELDRATRHYQQLITALSAVDGPDGERTLAARADAAVVDHARGLCTAARSQLTEVISAHQQRFGPAHPVGIRMIVRLAGMWRDCGDFDMAHQLFARARAEAASLPPDDEAHRLLSAASRAQADLAHQCGVETARPGADNSTGVFPVLVVPDPQDFIPPPRVGNGAGPQFAEWPEDEILDPPPQTRQAPNYLPPPAPGPPPVIFTAPRTIPAPLPVLRPPARPPRKRARSAALPLIAVGAAAAAAVALVAVAILASGKDSPQQTAQPTPTAVATATTPAAAPPVAKPSGPVGNLKLTDRGDNILITWIYPANADGPVIVSAAKAGEPMRALQSLPAGTESLTLPGLDPQRNYCVTVTVAYQADHLVMASPVCTTRKP